MSMKLLIAVLFVTPCFAWSQTEYVVREGDTLLKIADKALGSSDRKNPRRYDYANSLIKLNPSLKNPNALIPGQKILLPSEPVAAPAPAPTPALPKEVVKKETPSTEKVSPLQPVAEAAEAIAAKPEPNVAVPLPAATPTPPPAAAEVKPETHSAEEAHHNFIFVQPRYQLVKLESKEESTDTVATMKSTSSVGLDLQYGVVLNERWHVLLQAGITSTQFNDIEDHAGTVDHKSETLKSFAAGIAFEPTTSLHMDLLALYSEQSFLLPEAAGEYKLEDVAFPGAELNISWDIYSGARNILGISAMGEYLGAVTKDGIEYKSSLEPAGALYWKSNFGHDRVNYKVTLAYKHAHQETSVTKKTEELSVLGVGFYF